MKAKNRHPVLRMHRFLVHQSFYLLVLSSGFALSLYLARALATSTWLIYFNLVWNLVLAWVPYAISFLLAALEKLTPRTWWLWLPLWGIWLIFFPNAPYIVTDFLHLAPREVIPLWYDILLLASFSWTGIFLAIASLQTMQAIVKTHFGGLLSWGFAATALGLSALGMYLGRFERWNSWDLFFQPRSILADVLSRLANPFANLRFFGFTVLFTAFLTICYLMFLSGRRVEEEDQI